MRTTATWAWFVSGAIAFASGAMLWLQGQRVEQLRGEIRLKRDADVELQGLLQMRDDLVRQQTSAAELARLRADRAALVRLRTEMDALKAAEMQTARNTKQTPPPAPPLIPASAWKNAGRATPTAALETTLWAAVGGDIDALAEGLEFEPGARARIEALIASLPAEARRQYPTPEHLVALLAAKDIPAEGGARFLVRAQGESETVLGVVFQNGQKTQNKLLIARRDGEQWKLVVPHAAVEKYIAVLKGPAPIDNGK